MRWYRDVIKQIGSAIRFQDDTSARARRVDKHPKRTNFHFPILQMRIFRVPKQVKQLETSCCLRINAMRHFLRRVHIFEISATPSP